MPYSFPISSQIRFSRSASFNGLIVSVVVKKSNPPSEYEERTSEQERLIREFNGEWENEANRHPIHFVAGTYVPDDFYTAAKGLERYSRT